MLGTMAWLAAQPPQGPPGDWPVGQPTKDTARGIAERSLGGNMHTTDEIMLTVAIFLYALMAMAVLYILVHKEHATPFVLRIYVITVLIGGSLIVVSSAFTQDQLAPVMGLFGTIAGYLLGRGERPDVTP